MKSIASVFLFCALVASSAFADVEALYWQVTSENNPDVTFTHAVLVGIDGNSEKHALADSEGGVYQQALSGGKTTDVIASVIDPSYAAGWSFYVELWNNSSGNWVLAGTATDGGSPSSYTALKNQGSIISSMSMATPELFTPTAAVPEPTSGLLLLMGSALLALRRRRFVAA